MNIRVPEHLKVFKGRTVLVTGHTGFKGAWLSKWLTILGAKVVGYSLPPPTVPSLFKTIGLKDDIVHITGDVRDPKHLAQVFKRYKPQFVFHLAAQPLVRRSYFDPAGTFETNVMGTVHVLDAVRRSKGVKACVIITSDKCYENKEWVHAYRETDPMGGHDPYSASKGAAELTVSSYKRSFFAEKGLPAVSSARAGNIFGGGDWAEDRLVPDCVRALMKNKPIVVRSPKAIRPWQFVLDPLHGYLLLASRMQEDPAKFSGAWNFGPSYASNVTVQDIVKHVIKYWGSGTIKQIRKKVTRAPHEANFLKLDCAKANHLLGWHPITDLKGGLWMTVNWYREYARRTRSMAEYTTSLILGYMIALEKI